MIKKPKGNSPHPAGMVSARLLPNEKQSPGLLEDMADGYYETDLAADPDRGQQRLVPHFWLRQLRNRSSAIKYVHFMDEANARKMRAAFQRVLETGEPASAVECQIRRDDGELRMLELSITLRTRP